MSISPIALLHLPLVALIEVIKKIELKEFIKNLSNQFLKPWNTMKMGMNVFKIQENRNWLNVYYKDVRYGMKVLIEFISNLFNKEVDSVFINKNTVWMMNLVERLQGSSYTAIITHTHGETFNRFSDKEFMDILIRRNPKRLDIFHSPSNEFRFENYNKQYDRVLFRSGHWITLENLLTLDCIELFIAEDKLTSMDTNMFLKHWIQGGKSRLKVITFRVQDYEEDEVYADIKGFLKNVPGEQVYQAVRNELKFDGQLIVKEDSVMASILYRPMSKRFTLAVWPDINGKRVEELLE